MGFDSDFQRREEVRRVEERRGEADQEWDSSSQPQGLEGAAR
jgi:hypothetical protein